MVIAALLAIAQAGTAQFAPPDVPKSHWAYPAVNKLFEEGLLRGYPLKKPLDHRPSSKILTKDEMTTLLGRWLEKGLMKDAFSILIQARGGFSLDQATTYQVTVLVHRGWESICNGGPLYIGEHGETINAIHTVEVALKHLGADPKLMVDKLNRVYEQPNLKFHANSRLSNSLPR